MSQEKYFVFCFGINIKSFLKSLVGGGGLFIMILCFGLLANYYNLVYICLFVNKNEYIYSINEL